MIRTFKFLLISLCIPMMSLAGFGRHNEQGLSPSHTYKRSGEAGVVSNLNGNLVINSGISMFVNPTPVTASRTWNSHWRDPIIVHQYDMNYDTYAYGGKGDAKYDDRDISDLTPRSIGGFATRRIQRYNNSSNMPFNAEFAKNMSLSLVNQAISIQVIRLVQVKYASTIEILQMRYEHPELKIELTELQKKDIAQMEAISAAVSVFGGILDAYMNDGADYKAMARCYSGNQKQSDDCIRSNLNIMASLGVERYLDKGLSALSGTTVNIPVISIAMMTYDLAQGRTEDAAWQAGSIAAQAIVTAAVEGSAAGPVGIAVAVAIQLCHMAVDKIQADDLSFDVGWVEIDPWALGVNGYLGMLGTNHDPQRNASNGRFFLKWVEDSIRIDTLSPDSQIVTHFATSHVESRHPMPDLNLVGADGGATRFILSDDSVQVDSRNRRWVAYVGLSNDERRKVYYYSPTDVDGVDLGTNPSEDLIDKYQSMDALGFYLVKNPDGTQVYFRAKGIDRDFSGTSTYWAVPTGVRNGTGDSIAVMRDANQKLLATWDVRTMRGIKVDRSTPVVVRQGSDGGLSTSQNIQLAFGAAANPFTPLDAEKKVLPLSKWDEMLITGELNVQGASVLVTDGVDTVWDHFEEQDYEGFFSAKDQSHNETFPALSWEVRRGGRNHDNSDRRDTTYYAYAYGDLTSVASPEGSKVFYRYAGKRRDPLDGFVLESREFPETNASGVYKQTIYDYSGWSEARPQLMRTNVTTRLSQPDYASQTPSVRISEIADSYTFGALAYGMNVNRSLAGFSARTTVFTNDTIKDTTKVLDSLEYKTVRYHLLSEVHGAGSPGQTRTVTQWDGDKKTLAIESKGLARTLDPRVKVWKYDRQGNVIQERICPKDVLDIMSQKMQGASVNWSLCPEVRTDLSNRTNDVGEYWSFDVDTVTINGHKTAVDNSKLNHSFSPEHAYQDGISTSKRVFRVQGTDTTLIADSTVFDSAQYGWLRPTSNLAWLGGKWVETQRTGYRSDRPAVANKSWRRLGGDSASLTETSYDADITFPTASTSYVSATSMGASGAGKTLVASFVNNAQGQIIKVTDAGGHSTDSLRDARGRVIKVVRPDGSTISTEYGDRLVAWKGASTGYPWIRSLYVRETDPMGVQSEARFDGLGRMLGLVKRPIDGNDSQVTLTSYSIFDKLQFKRDPDCREEYHDYDLSGRLVASRVYKAKGDNSGAALSWLKSYAWNDSARTLIETDELNTKTVFHWDSHGRDTLIVRDSGRLATGLVNSTQGVIQVRQSYDNIGNLVQLTDPKGLIEKRRYDERNRLLETIYPDDLRHAVGYDIAGRIVSDTQSSISGTSRVTKNIWYDGLDRLVSESYGNSARENISYNWDGTNVSDNGRLVSVARGTGMNASYSYDALGRRTQRNVTIQNLYAASQGWIYDASGTPISTSLPGGGLFSYGFDGYHRMNRQSFAHGALGQIKDSTNLLHDVSYLNNDLMTGYGLGTSLKALFEYEPVRGVLTRNLVVHTSGNMMDTIYRQSLSWDDAGNVAGMRRHSGDSLGFGMDRLYQLREVSYSDGQHLLTDYDPNGNRIRHDHPMGFGVSDTFNYAGNRVSSGSTARKGVTVFRHDVLGNLSTEADFANALDSSDISKAWHVIERNWNRRNELERVRIITRLDRPDTVILRYDYGEDGNRIASMVAGAIAGTDTTWMMTRAWVYDGTSIVADSGSGHGWNWHAFHGLNRIAEITDTSAGSARIRYVLVDHQGSTQQLLDDTGTVLGKWVWDPWGNVEFAHVDATTDLLYQGKTYEPKLGEWYFNARWYNPERGSFTGRDAKLQFWSPYNYVGNAPSHIIDADGKDAYVQKDYVKHEMNISADIVIWGDGASKEVAQQIQAKIASDWRSMEYENGDELWRVKFNVNVSYYGADKPSILERAAMYLNNENVIQVTNDKSKLSKGSSYVGFGGASGTWRGNGSWGSRGNPSSHEFGHILGLEDRYSPGLGPDKDWKGNIMDGNASNPHPEVDERNIAPIFKWSSGTSFFIKPLGTFK